MKKTLLLAAVAVISTFALLSCGGEDTKLVNPDGTNNPGVGSGSVSKCFLSEVNYSSDFLEYTTKFKYDSKNLLLENEDDMDAKTTYEYDSQNRITKMTINDFGIYIFKYEYDSKGNITKAKYSSPENSQTSFNFSDFVFNTNSKGLIDKISVTVEDQDVNFLIEYDTKNNIKKILADWIVSKEVLLENISFDEKTSPYINNNLSKAYLPWVLAGLMFEANYTPYCNVNNVLSSKQASYITGETNITTYTYEYTKEGYPSKMKSVAKSGGDTEEEQETYKYTCK